MTKVTFDKLTDDDKKTLNKVHKLHLERNNLADRFVTAKESAEEEVIKLTAKINQLEEDKKEVYTMFALDEIDATALKDVNKQLEDANEMLQMYQDKLNNIHEVEKKEVKRQIEHKLKPLHSDLVDINNKNTNNIKSELLEAKNKYLELFKQANQQYNAVNKYVRIEEGIKVFTGTQKNAYSGLENPILNFINNDYDNSKGADVSTEEIKRAYARK